MTSPHEDDQPEYTVPEWALPPTNTSHRVHINERGGKQSASDHFLRGLPPRAILRVARILKRGAETYEADPFGNVLERNWHKVSANEHLEHLLKHIILELDGDTSEDHPGHIATRALFYLHQHLVERGLEP